METKPIRIQRSRQHKMVSPNGLPIVYVGRPTMWGNPFVVGEMTSDGKIVKDAEMAAGLYRMLATVKFPSVIKQELKEKNLACWCKIGHPCHADILLEIANQ